jgi:hypothetical protein
VCDILGALGYEALRASSCEQALDHFLGTHDGQAELLLMEMSLLSSSGFEVIRAGASAPHPCFSQMLHRHCCSPLQTALLMFAPAAISRRTGATRQDRAHHHHG